MRPEDHPPPQPAARNGESPHHHHNNNHRRHSNNNYNSSAATPFHSTLSAQKLRRINYLIIVFRLAAFCSSLASAVFMLANSRRGSSAPRWHDFDAFRFVVAANAIVAIYSLFEMVASVWEISRAVTLFPEVIQVWFDFGHDQVFAYLLLCAVSAGTALVRTMRMDTCKASSGFCVQADISIALGFMGFLFLGFSSLLSGFRVACFIINGSRFHL